MDKKKIRVLQYVPTLGRGGISSVVLNYYKHINKEKFIFDFITHGKVEDFHKAIKATGSNIYYVGSIRENGVFRYFNKIRKIFREGEYDIIHFHVTGLRWLLLADARKNAHKLVLTHAHSTKVSNISRLYVLFAAMLNVKFLACGMQAGDAFYFGKPFTLLPNAIEVDKFIFVDKEKVNNIRNSIICSQDTLLIGTVGILNVQKNHSFLIKLAVEMRMKNLDFHIIIVGDGPLKKQIQESIKAYNLNRYFTLLGKRNDVNVILNSLDIFVLPSLFEGLPVVGIEAQFSGCSCIFSDSVTKEVNQNITPVEFLSLSSVDKWIESIEKFGKRFTSREEVQEKACDSLYSIRNSVKLLEKIYLDER